MLNSELDRTARASLQRRRDHEAQRKERVFNHKERTIGVDLEALQLQIKEKKKHEEAAKEEHNAYDNELLQNSKVANLLHNRQVKQKQAMEKAVVNYRHQFQQPCTQQGFDLNNPDRRETELAEAQMMLPGLVGEDPDSENRRLRQRQQLRGWLMQQQSERASERHQQEQRDNQSRVEMDNRALQLHSLDAERRKAAAVATKEFNLAQIEEECRQKADLTEEDYQVKTVKHLQGQLTGEDAPQGMVGVPGFYPGDDRRTSQESVQQVIQFQKNQVEEKKRMGLQKKQEEEQHDRVRLDSARAALLIERQQARLNKQLRRHLDNTNVRLAEVHKERKPDIERGRIDNSFFSQFNTCSR
ncbi:RIB43A-like with coiled-coils protein 2 isoform X2 [Notolabrus celidotus]|uniref:RIB43A-like with coiled-coils protein 2 isoform X2 n=1 Tax=Notolabrus celidotus TaxID=1203425 RepID=UPI00148F652E|nr:RIB43A-like with coiled-coils protein 2 isoform X2 [Notolabrus celidotus]